MNEVELSDLATAEQTVEALDDLVCALQEAVDEQIAAQRQITLDGSPAAQAAAKLRITVLKDTWARLSDLIDEMVEEAQDDYDSAWDEARQQEVDQALTARYGAFCNACGDRHPDGECDLDPRNELVEVTVKVGGIGDGDRTFTVPAAWADRVRAVAPHLQYGPNYDRSVATHLSDLDACVRRGYSTVGYDHLVWAETAAARKKG